MTVFPNWKPEELKIINLCINIGSSSLYTDPVSIKPDHYYEGNKLVLVFVVYKCALITKGVIVLQTTKRVPLDMLNGVLRI